MPTSSVTIRGRVTGIALERKLPRVCLVCGEAARGKPVSRTFHRWHPAALFVAPLLLAVLVLIGIGGGAPGATGGTGGDGVLTGMCQRVKIAAPVCRQHRRVWGWRTVLLALAFLPCVGGGLAAGVFGVKAVAPAAHLPELVTGGVGVLAGFVGWIILYLILRAGAPRLHHTDDRGVTLLGVSPVFAAAVAEGWGDVGSETQGVSRRAIKQCLHCRKQLPRYADACRFCKQLLVKQPGDA